MCVLLVMILVVSACGNNSVLATQTQVLDTSPTKLPTITSAQNAEKEPHFEIQPESALSDEIVKMRVLDLRPGQLITLRATMNDDVDLDWASSATFVANSAGVVDLTTQAPISGTYDTVDPMGLIWSMLPDVTGSEYPYFANWDTPFVLVTITAESEGQEIATAHLRRMRLNSAVRKVQISENGLVGYFFSPNTEGQNPGLIVLGGSDGGGDIPMAALLASRGYATLALYYFGNSSLPPDLSEIPLEYFEVAIAWLKSQEGVNGNEIGVIGTSRGGELALLLGATFPEVKAVVGYVASGVVMGNLESR